MFFRFNPRKTWQEKIFDRVFKDRKIRQDQLLPFGFVQGKHGFSYRANLLAGMFHLDVDIHPDGSVHVAVNGAEEMEYDLLRSAQDASATFLDRQLRREYEEELWHVAECCFEPDVFKNEITRRVISYIRTTYGDELEFLWRKSPESAIIRRRDKGTWYAVFLVIPRSRLDGASVEKIEVLNLRVNPAELESCVDNVSRFPGYHMNKKNWASLCLDGSVPFDELVERLEASYRLALK